MTTSAEVIAWCPSGGRGSVDECSSPHNWPGWMPGSAGHSTAWRFQYLSYWRSPVMRCVKARQLVAGSSAIVNVTLSPAAAGNGARSLVIAILPASRPAQSRTSSALAALVERPQAGSQIGAVDKNIFTQTHRSIDQFSRL